VRASRRNRVRVEKWGFAGEYLVCLLICLIGLYMFVLIINFLRRKRGGGGGVYNRY
jgi:hypothetical protein